MVNIGQKEIYTAHDGWTIFTKDGKPSAHFEHTIAITSDGPIILSERVTSGKGKPITIDGIIKETLPSAMFRVDVEIGGQNHEVLAM